MTLRPARSRFSLRFRIYNWQFNAGWFPTLTTILLLTLLINLGNWQMRRAEFREQSLERYAERQHQWLSLEQLWDLDTDSGDYPISVEGEFLHQYAFLLDNRLHQGRPGFELLTPLRRGNRLILVNRGWIPMGRTRADLPPYPQPTDRVTVTGHTHVPNPDFFVLQEDDYGNPSWPFIVQKIHLEKTAALFDTPLAPFIIREAPEPGSGFVRNWHSQMIGPEKHYGYAVQWYALALALLIIYIAVNSRRHQQDDIENDD